MSVNNGTRNGGFDFGSDLDHCLDPGMFLIITLISNIGGIETWQFMHSLSTHLYIVECYRGKQEKKEISANQELEIITGVYLIAILGFLQPGFYFYY